MAQTPISTSVLYNSTTPTTIYTVPSGKTAVVKGVLAASQVASYDTVTLNKVSNGTTYPLVRNQLSGYASYGSSTYYPSNVGEQTINLLKSPITLSAGESISISTSGTSYYKANVTASSSSYKIAQFKYLNGNYIAVGQDSSNALGLILTSTDGITYTRRTFTPTVQLTNITFGNGYYVVCNATGGTIHHSTDLVTWTEVALPTTFPCYAITYGGGKFVTGGGSGRSYYATSTPLSWTAATVFQSGTTIYAISYIGTNYFYGNAGISYYTADFTTFTQPYIAILSGTNSTGSVAASPNKLLTTNTLVPSTNQNTFLRTSTDGITWSAVTTSGNSMSSYSGRPYYVANGGYYIQRIYNTSNGEYMYSPDGSTWSATQFSHLTGYTNTGNYCIVPAYENTSNASYTNKAIVYQVSGGNNYLQGTNVSASGVLSNQNFSQSVAAFGDGTITVSGAGVIAGNPFDGSWVFMGYYATSSYQAGWAYGSGPNTFGTTTYGLYNPSYGYTIGSCCSVGVMPNSAVYLAGSTTNNVWRQDTYNGGWYPYMGHPSYTSSPAGWDYSAAGGGSGNCVGFARSGDLSTSILVILFSNGYFARTNNQGTSWTFGNVGASSFSTQMDNRSAGPLRYGNGKFWAINSSGLTVFSTDGISWTTMISAVASIYQLNSLNVFLTQGGIFTSSGSTVNSFDTKSSTNYTSANWATDKLTYVGSQYWLIDGATLYSSSDLITWTSKAFNSTADNDSSFWTAGNSAIAYSGTGTNLALANANVITPTTSSSISKPITPSSNIYVGAATASIVQID